MTFKVGGYLPEICDNFQELECSLIMKSSGDYEIPQYTPISNQGQLSSCVGTSLGDCIELLIGIKNPSKVQQISRLFIYYNSRKYHNATHKDAGTYISNAMESLIKYGICLESNWIYDPLKVNKQPSLKAYKQAKDNEFKIGAYYQIKNNSNKLSSIESAIRSNHPVIFGVDIGQEYLGYKGKDKIFNPPTKSIGGHAQLIIGVKYINNQRCWVIRNSWGTSFGNKGYALFSDEYITTARDCFVLSFDKDLVV